MRCLCEHQAYFRPRHNAHASATAAGARPAGDLEADPITIENVYGRSCDAMRRYLARYAETVREYCPNTAPAARASGLDVPTVNTEAARPRASWPASPGFAQHCHLAAIFLAAGERHSALVQWLRLPENERRAGEGLEAALVAELEMLKTRRNESGLIAAVLAARLGLERVWSIDDHTADTANDLDLAVRKVAADALMNA